jgi:hypothetical protein
MALSIEPIGQKRNFSGENHVLCAGARGKSLRRAQAQS